MMLLVLFLIFSFMFSVDSDGDGYQDSLEEKIGTDPNNKQDRYYIGSWPYSIDKEKIKGTEFPVSCPSNISCECEQDSDCINSNCKKGLRGGSYCTPKQGDLFPHFIAVDQYGESVDIYDFSMNDKMVVVEFGAAWCAPCQQLSSWISSGDTTLKKNRWWKDEYSVIKDMIDNGDIFFITILYQDPMREPANYDTVSDWHEKYPKKQVPILADEYADIHQWIKPTGYPCINILDQNMRLINFTTRGLGEAFDMLSGLQPIPMID